MAEPTVGSVRLVVVGQVDGSVYGAVLPADHTSADLDGYGVKADPAAWALIEALTANQTSDRDRRDAAAYRRLLDALPTSTILATLPSGVRNSPVRLERDRAYAGEDVVGVRLHIGDQSTPAFEVPEPFASILDGLVQDLNRARSVVAALVAAEGAA